MAQVSACFALAVNRLAARPYSVSLAMLIASSVELTVITESTGPKISSFAKTFVIGFHAVENGWLDVDFFHCFATQNRLAFS